MIDYTLLSEKSSIPVWYFEVAAGRPALKCELSEVTLIREFLRTSTFNSEEEYAGQLRLLELLMPLAQAATSPNEMLFVRQNSLALLTPAYVIVTDKMEQAENPEHHRRLNRERASEEAGLLKRLELSVSTEEMWEVVFRARGHSSAAVQAALCAIVEHSKALSNLTRVFELSLFWYETRIASVRKIIELYEQGTLEL